MSNEITPWLESWVEEQAESHGRKYSAAPRTKSKRMQIIKFLTFLKAEDEHRPYDDRCVWAIASDKRHTIVVRFSDLALQEHSRNIASQGSAKRLTEAKGAVVSIKTFKLAALNHGDRTKKVEKLRTLCLEADGVVVHGSYNSPTFLNPRNDREPVDLFEDVQILHEWLNELKNNGNADCLLKAPPLSFPSQDPVAGPSRLREPTAPTRKSSTPTPSPVKPQAPKPVKPRTLRELKRIVQKAPEAFRFPKVLGVDESDEEQELKNAVARADVHEPADISLTPKRRPARGPLDLGSSPDGPKRIPYIPGPSPRFSDPTDSSAADDDELEDKEVEDPQIEPPGPQNDVVERQPTLSPPPPKSTQPKSAKLSPKLPTESPLPDLRLMAPLDRRVSKHIARAQPPCGEILAPDSSQVRKEQTSQVNEEEETSQENRVRRDLQLPSPATSNAGELREVEEANLAYHEDDAGALPSEEANAGNQSEIIAHDFQEHQRDEGVAQDVVSREKGKVDVSRKEPEKEKAGPQTARPLFGDETTVLDLQPNVQHDSSPAIGFSQTRERSPSPLPVTSRPSKGYFSLLKDKNPTITKYAPDFSKPKEVEEVPDSQPLAEMDSDDAETSKIIAARSLHRPEEWEMPAFIRPDKGKGKEKVKEKSPPSRVFLLPKNKERKKHRSVEEGMGSRSSDAVPLGKPRRGESAHASVDDARLTATTPSSEGPRIKPSNSLDSLDCRPLRSSGSNAYASTSKQPPMVNDSTEKRKAKSDGSSFRAATLSKTAAERLSRTTKSASRQSEVQRFKLSDARRLPNPSEFNGDTSTIEEPQQISAAKPSARKFARKRNDGSRTSASSMMEERPTRATKLVSDAQTSTPANVRPIKRSRASEAGSPSERPLRKRQKVEAGVMEKQSKAEPRTFSSLITPPPNVAGQTALRLDAIPVQSEGGPPWATMQDLISILKTTMDLRRSG